ncbi:DeoR/GlpR family DNA-binding transcription regulator [Cytobacillus firmus]|uniref:Transcriptional regulator of rhamnose utilization, DeoR family n=1 Tax=Cytobacillus firmus TaxID=1399 RepID=A0A800N974_CYTFI|nr:DeoR/GlpR family DNA-binding transcription regulator [Cytobacillus firmus]KAF0822205.1 Transcriptional regulator of rhamnose utilization, DeoR family [Cytobacillus firmus]
MLVAERQQKIVELVNIKSSVRVSELSEYFSVTEETIRRDLEKLERENKLKRSHGGAVSIQEEDPDVAEREITNVTEKKAIANEAAKLVENGDRIILDASSTAWYMAKALPNIPLTVITNSIKVSMELSKKDKIEVISTGGKLDPKSMSHIGPLAARSLDMYHVNKVFISCKGIHLDNGLSDSNEEQAILKKRMGERSDKVFVMADSSKFGVKGFSQIMPINKAHYIITDSKVDFEIKKRLEELRLTISIAKV